MGAHMTESNESVPVRTSFTKYEFILISTKNATYDEVMNFLKNLYDEVFRKVLGEMNDRCKKICKYYFNKPNTCFLEPMNEQERGLFSERIWDVEGKNFACSKKIEMGLNNEDTLSGAHTFGKADIALLVPIPHTYWANIVKARISNSQIIEEIISFPLTRVKYDKEYRKLDKKLDEKVVDLLPRNEEKEKIEPELNDVLEKEIKILKTAKIQYKGENEWEIDNNFGNKKIKKTESGIEILEETDTNLSAFSNENKYIIFIFMELSDDSIASLNKEEGIIKNFTGDSSENLNNFMSGNNYTSSSRFKKILDSQDIENPRCELFLTLNENHKALLKVELNNYNVIEKVIKKVKELKYIKSTSTLVSLNEEYEGDQNFSDDKKNIPVSFLIKLKLNTDENKGLNKIIKIIKNKYSIKDDQIKIKHKGYYWNWVVSFNLSEQDFVNLPEFVGNKIRPLKNKKNNDPLIEQIITLPYWEHFYKEDGGHDIDFINEPEKKLERERVENWSLSEGYNTPTYSELSSLDGGFNESSPNESVLLNKVYNCRFKLEWVKSRFIQLKNSWDKEFEDPKCKSIFEEIINHIELVTQHSFYLFEEISCLPLPHIWDALEQDLPNEINELIKRYFKHLETYRLVGLFYNFTEQEDLTVSLDDIPFPPTTNDEWDEINEEIARRWAEDVPEIRGEIKNVIKFTPVDIDDEIEDTQRTFMVYNPENMISFTFEVEEDCLNLKLGELMDPVGIVFGDFHNVKNDLYRKALNDGIEKFENEADTKRGLKIISSFFTRNLWLETDWIYNTVLTFERILSSLTVEFNNRLEGDQIVSMIEPYMRFGEKTGAFDLSYRSINNLMKSYTGKILNERENNIPDNKIGWEGLISTSRHHHDYRIYSRYPILLRPVDFRLELARKLLPIAHEGGHYIIYRYKKIGEGEFKKIFSELKNKLEQRLGNKLNGKLFNEIMADLLTLIIAGPSYIKSLLMIYSPYYTYTQKNQLRHHPPFEIRITICKEACKILGWQEWFKEENISQLCSMTEPYNINPWITNKKENKYYTRKYKKLQYQIKAFEKWITEKNIKKLIDFLNPNLLFIPWSDDLEKREENAKEAYRFCKKISYKLMYDNRMILDTEPKYIAAASMIDPIKRPYFPSYRIYLSLAYTSGEIRPDFN